ncbi:hypothetical protein HAX54_046865, partial [Datura stramonium]|nr:hypothetical protein [Datura stramonium]
MEEPTARQSSDDPSMWFRGSDGEIDDRQESRLTGFRGTVMCGVMLRFRCSQVMEDLTGCQGSDGSSLPPS